MMNLLNPTDQKILSDAKNHFVQQNEVNDIKADMQKNVKKPLVSLHRLGTTLHVILFTHFYLKIVYSLQNFS